MKLLKLSLLAATAAFFTGCASIYPVGSFYTGVNLPVDATSNGMGSKKGTAVANSYLGLVAIGDASIETAKKNGGITKVSHVDWDAKNILGLFGTYTCTVYGE